VNSRFQLERCCPEMPMISVWGLLSVELNEGTALAITQHGCFP
jgi:hypothetical protein